MSTASGAETLKSMLMEAMQKPRVCLSSRWSSDRDAVSFPLGFAPKSDEWSQPIPVQHSEELFPMSRRSSRIGNGFNTQTEVPLDVSQFPECGCPDLKMLAPQLRSVVLCDEQSLKDGCFLNQNFRLAVRAVVRL